MINDFTSTGGVSCVNSCGSRLPCGLCLITNKPCPMMTTTYEPSWTVNTGTTTTAK